MNQTVTVSTKTINEIFSRLDELTNAVKKMAAKLSEKEFSYGSDEWWDKEIKEAEIEFKKGRGVVFKSSKDAIKWLNS